jgi:hypothetical protein
MHTRILDFGTVLKDRLRLPDQPIAQQGIRTRGYSEARYGGTHRTGPATWWITKACDRAGVPDLSVRWIISIGGGGDSRDPTTNEQVMAP